jgi:hypothetical protein
MQKIINHNCAGLCCQKYCDEPETHFVQVKINGMEFLIGFCEKHAEEFENKLLGRIIECQQN